MQALQTWNTLKKELSDPHNHPQIHKSFHITPEPFSTYLSNPPILNSLLDLFLIKSLDPSPELTRSDVHHHYYYGNSFLKEINHQDLGLSVVAIIWINIQRNKKNITVLSSRSSFLYLKRISARAWGESSISLMIPVLFVMLISLRSVTKSDSTLRKLIKASIKEIIHFCEDEEGIGFLRNLVQKHQQICLQYFQCKFEQEFLVKE